MNIVTLKLVNHLLRKNHGEFSAHILGFQGRGHLSPNVLSTENVSYNTIGQTVRMAAQANLTCSENISYATIEYVNKDTHGSTVAPSLTAVYDEVVPRK